MYKKKLVGSVLAIALLLTGSVCSAASWISYNTTVGKLNGSGYTGSTTSTVSKDHAAWLDSFTVGGNYTVDARLQGYKDSAYKSINTWIQKVNDDKLYYYNYCLGISYKQGRFQFSNDLLTPVNVQVTGEYKLED